MEATQQSIPQNGITRSQLFAEVQKYRLTLGENNPRIEPVIQIMGKNIATKGDFTFVAGLPKAGKTSLSIYFLATAVMKSIPLGMDTLGIRTLYADDKPVLFIDNEQGAADTVLLALAICKLLGTTTLPHNIHIYRLRGVGRKKKLNEVQKIIQAYEYLHLCIIDGIADLVADPNNPEKSFDLLDEFMVLTEKLNTCFILYLHFNPNTAKMRGNLGSEGERKARGVVSISKDRKRGVYKIECVMIRGDGDFEDIYCKYDHDLGRLVGLEADQEKIYKNEVDRDTIKLNDLLKLAIMCFAGSNGSLIKQEMADLIMQYSEQCLGKALKESAAKNKVDYMERKGIVIKTGNKYELADPKSDK